MKAAVATGNKEPPFTHVKDVPKPTVKSGQILVQTVAVAANPADWKQLYWFAPKGIVGSDGAGVVEEVASDVVGFKRGDIVSCFARGSGNLYNGTFGEYFITRPENTIKFTKFNPDVVLPEGENPVQKLDNFDAISTVPLGLATVGVSFSSVIGLSEKDKGETILIWGGATATGIIAIQIAKLVYGLKVITTASKKNFELVKSVGADWVFDYNDDKVTENVKSIGFKYALDTVSSQETLQAAYDCSTENTVQIDTLLHVDVDAIKKDPSKQVKFSYTFVYHTLVDESGFPGAACLDEETMKKFSPFWNEDLPSVIDKLQTPRPLVLKKGAESAEEALSLLYNNKVSGQKVVFRV